jgi:capsular polysaccharide biosynthesis protein
MGGFSAPSRPGQRESGMTIGGGLTALRRRWLLVVAGVVLGAAAGGFVEHEQKPKFQTTATVALSETRNLFLSPLVVKAYADAAATTLVLTHAPGKVPRQLASQLNRDPRGIEVPADSNLVRFTVIAPGAASAAREADNAATAFGRYVSQSSRGALSVSLVNPAQVPAFAYSPRKSVSIVVGMLIGLAAVTFLVLRTERP